MDCINHGMLPPFLDKLLLDCVVQLDQIEMLPCEICDKVFYGEENLMKHLITHIIVKNEDTESDTNICTDNNKSRHNQMVSNSDTVSNPGTIAKTIHIANATEPKPQNTSSSICNQMNSNSGDDASPDQQANDINNGSHNKSVNWKKKKLTVVFSSHNCKEKDATEASTANKDPTPFHHTLATRPCVKKSYGKLYSCRICKEQFAHKSFLEKHELNHQEMVQVTCDDSSHQPQLKKDMGKEHTNRKECTDRQARTDRKKRTDRTACTDISISGVRSQQMSSQPQLNTDMGKKRTKREEHTENRAATAKKELRQEKQYICDICLKSFQRRCRLRNHIQIHFLGKAYSCKFCEKAFRFKIQLQRHNRIHTDERPYSCPICNISFRNHSSLSYHRGTHTGQAQQMICALCNKQYGNKIDVMRHIYSIHIRTGYPCRICKKEFGHPVIRTRHITSLHSSRNYKCKFCDKIYIHKYRLERHEKSHNKPFECDLCKKRFGRKDHLSKHIKNVCTPKKPFRCGKCKKQYNTNGFFKRHVKKCRKS